MLNTTKARASKAKASKAAEAVAESIAAEAAATEAQAPFFAPAVAVITPDASDIFAPGEADTFQQATTESDAATTEAATGNRTARTQAAAKASFAGTIYIGALVACGGDATGKRLPVKSVPPVNGTLRGSEATARSAAALIACAAAHGIRIEPGAVIPLRFAESAYLETGCANDIASRYSCTLVAAGPDSHLICGNNTRAMLRRIASEATLACFAV